MRGNPGKMLNTLFFSFRLSHKVATTFFPGRWQHNVHLIRISKGYYLFILRKTSEEKVIDHKLRPFCIQCYSFNLTALVSGNVSRDFPVQMSVERWNNKKEWIKNAASTVTRGSLHAQYIHKYNKSFDCIYDMKLGIFTWANAYMSSW